MIYFLRDPGTKKHMNTPVPQGSLGKYIILEVDDILSILSLGTALHGFLRSFVLEQLVL